MTELARLGFTILGLYVAIGPLAGLAGNVIKNLSEDNAPILVAALAYAVGWFVFGLIPGVVLIRKAENLSIRLFGPSSDDSLEINSQNLLAAALAVAGVVIAIDGFAILLTAATIALVTAGFDTYPPAWLENAIRGTLLLVLGVLLTTKSGAVAIRLLPSRAKPGV